MSNQMRDIHDTISLEIANKIGEKILNGEIQEGTQLKILDISKQYNVSQTAAREALFVLERSYLVGHLPRRGTFVRQVRENDAIILYEVKRRLLGYSMQCVCAKYPTHPEARLQMEKQLSELLTNLRKGDEEAANIANIALTRLLLDSLDSDYLVDSLANIEYQIKRFRIHNAFQTEAGRLVAAHHIYLLSTALDEPHLAEKRMLDYLDAVKSFVFTKPATPPEQKAGLP